MSAETQTEKPTQPQSEPAGRSDEAGIESTPRRRFNPVIIGAIVLVLLLVAIGIYLYTRQYETTDDAQVDGHLNPIASRIDGTITAVHADDNQIVQAGALLVELDPSDDKIALEQATAQYDQATAQLNATHPNVPITRINNSSDLSSQQAEVQGAEASLAAAQHDLDGAVARLKEAQATNERDQADYLRYKDLNDKQEVARTLYDQAKATAEAQTQIVAASVAAVASSQKTVELRASQLAEARSKLTQVQNRAPLQLAAQEADIKGQQANAEATQAALEQSRLNLAYTRIPAPVAGVVTERSAEVGERISKGQQLFMIVQIDDLWVTANFKETQLAKMRPGERVTIHVDALSRDFDGTVESMPAVTGSRTSVLPPENATGNYVKVIQRLPVRIRFKAGQKDLDKLRPGMSVEPKVWLD
jgi:membrane fusion protein (multidrug efflux system)